MNPQRLNGELEIALEKGVWGVSEKAKGLWSKVQPGDRVVFYASKTGIIGHGVVEEKFVSNELLWPREKQEGEGSPALLLQDTSRENLRKPEAEAQEYARCLCCQ